MSSDDERRPDQPATRIKARCHFCHYPAGRPVAVLGSWLCYECHQWQPYVSATADLRRERDTLRAYVAVLRAKLVGAEQEIRVARSEVRAVLKEQQMAARDWTDDLMDVVGQRDQLRAVLAPLLDDPIARSKPVHRCAFCHFPVMPTDLGYQPAHSPDCPVLRRDALLGREGG